MATAKQEEALQIFMLFILFSTFIKKIFIIILMNIESLMVTIICVYSIITATCMRQQIAKSRFKFACKW